MRAWAKIKLIRFRFWLIRLLAGQQGVAINIICDHGTILTEGEVMMMRNVVSIGNWTAFRTKSWQRWFIHTTNSSGGK